MTQQKSHCQQTTVAVNSQNNFNILHEGTQPNPVVSFFKNGIIDVIPNENISISELHKRIASDIYRDKIEKLRHLTWILSKDNERTKNHKKTLPYFIASGIYSRRANNALIKSANLLQVDLDNLSDSELMRAKSFCNSCKHTVLSFVSPSGNGLKSLLRAKFANKIEYDSAFIAVARLFHNAGFEIDAGAKPMSQPLYVSYDNDAYLNLNADYLAYELHEPEKLARSQPNVTTHLNISDYRLKRILEAAIDAELDNIRTAPKGLGSRTFNKAIIAIAGYAHTGAINDTDIREDFIDAFLSRKGHSKDEGEAKFKSAWAYGSKREKRIGEGSECK